MKLKIWICGKYVFVPAEFADDFIARLNEVCAVAQEKDGNDFIPFQPLTLELRAD